jgi:predicted N-formylglutamate amidohydrolase
MAVTASLAEPAARRLATPHGPDQAWAEAPAVEQIDRAPGAPPVLLLCDHAGRRVPPELGDLGVPAASFARHIAFDIGAAGVTRTLAAELGAAALLCHVSRLVIDPNRRPGAPSSIPALSDGTVVPANESLDARERAHRAALGFLPYHRAIARVIAAHRRAGETPALISVHSFAPELAGVARPWHAGVLWNDDGRIARPLLDALRREPGLQIGDNQPYSARVELGYTIPFHAERTRLPHVTLEIRQDEIARPEAAARWARRLATALRPILADAQLYTPLRRD